MPYRAMFSTIITVALTLLAIGLWLRAVQPIVAESNAATASAPVGIVAPAAPASTNPAIAPPSETQLKAAVQMVLLLSFLLICMILVVGFFATLREWVRYTSMDSPKRKKTKYVNAWKLAGERLDPDAPLDK